MPPKIQISAAAKAKRLGLSPARYVNQLVEDDWKWRKGAIGLLM
jgi:hypothetical protein